MNSIEIRSLTKNYGKKPVLRGLNMNVPSGAVYGFLGVNGAGKTTTLGILTGFLPRGSGTVSVRGSLSSLPQDAALYPDRRVLGQLKLLARLGGVKGRRAGREAARVLDLVQLGEYGRSTPKKLSHGMRKRLAIAQALLGDPDILILDEPTAGLDPRNSAELRKLIRRLGREKTVVVSSHLLPEVEEMCSHVGVIHDGEMVFEGTVAGLTGVGSHVRYRLSGNVDPASLDGIGAIRTREYDGEEMILSVSFDQERATVEEINERVIAALRGRGVGIREITLGRSLEEEFFARTQGTNYNPEIINRIRGKCLCFTGALQSMFRNDARAKVESLGGSWNSTVTNAVDILVAGSIPRTAIIAGQLSIKLMKARQKGTEIISEETFLQMIQDAEKVG